MSSPNEAPSSVAGEYDPKNDPTRKPRKSTDPGWKYGFWPDLQNKDKVECTLCGQVVSGGIKRLKQHLAGAYGDAKLCPKASSGLNKEMTSYLEANKRKRPMFLDEDEEDDEVVEVVAADGANDTSVVESQACRLSLVLVQQPKKRQSTLQFKASSKAQPKTAKSVVEMLRRTPEDVVDERLSGSYQPTILASAKSKEDKHYVDMQWALFFYECGVPFNVAAARQFQIAIEATTQFGSGYKPPTPYQLEMNPGKLHPLIRNDDDATVGQLRGCFLDVLARMVDDEKTRDKINSQAIDYEFLRGAAFSNKMAIDNLQTMSPRKCLWMLLVYYLLVVASSLLNCCVVIAVEWWRSYGGRAIELQRFARRLVSLCASSSGCERNWSTFEFVSYYVCLLKSSSTYLATFVTNISGLND
jgi:hypothetical protein